LYDKEGNNCLFRGKIFVRTENGYHGNYVIYETDSGKFITHYGKIIVKIDNEKKLVEHVKEINDNSYLQEILSKRLYKKGLTQFYPMEIK